MAVDKVVREEPVVQPTPRRFARLKRLPVVPLAIITMVVLTAFLANLLTPYSPTDISLSQRLKPPFWEKGGSLMHPLGTDPMGRDLLTRMIYGARVSLVVAVLALLVGGGIGAALGLIAGYHGGRLDALVMRVADTTMAF